MLFLRKSIAKKLRSILYAFSKEYLYRFYCVFWFKPKKPFYNFVKKRFKPKNFVQFYIQFYIIFWLYLYLNNRVPAKNNPLNHPSFYVY